VCLLGERDQLRWDFTAHHAVDYPQSWSHLHSPESWCACLTALHNVQTSAGRRVLSFVPHKDFISEKANSQVVLPLHKLFAVLLTILRTTMAQHWQSYTPQLFLPDLPLLWREDSMLQLPLVNTKVDHLHDHYPLLHSWFLLWLQGINKWVVKNLSCYPINGFENEWPSPLPPINRPLGNPQVLAMLCIYMHGFWVCS
jgi:hypothetical protein